MKNLLGTSCGVENTSNEGIITSRRREVALDVEEVDRALLRCCQGKSAKLHTKVRLSMQM